MDEQSGPVTELFGRESALTTVAHHTTAARRGAGGRAVLVRGARGSGKSSVLRRAAASEAHVGTTVLSAVGRGERRPLAVARRLLVGQGVIVPELTDPSPADLYRVYQGMWRDVVTLAERTPVCLVLDDLDACDAATVRWVDFLVRRLGEEPISLVLSHHAPLAADLARAHVVDLQPLTTPQVADMISTTLHFPPDDVFTSLCLRLSGGIPRHLTTVLADIRAARALRQESVELVAARRLRDQPDHLRAIATALVVVDSEELVGPLAGVSARVAESGISVLRNEHLLGDGLPDHVREWYRAGMLDVLDPAEIADLRHRAALVLDESGHDVRAVADQLVHLPDVDTPWMSQVLREAAAGGKPQDAARYLRRLVELHPDDVELRVNLATELSRHDPGAACEHLAAAFHRTTDPDLRAALAVKHALTGRTRTFLRLARDPALSGDLVTLLDAVQLSIDLEDVHAVSAAVATAVPPRAGDTTAQRCLLGVVAEATMRGGGSMDDAVSYARAALADSEALTDWSMLSAATVLRVAGRTAEALAVLDRAVDAFSHNGDSLAHCRSLVQRALVHQSVGDLDLATQDAWAAVRTVRERGWQLPRAIVLLAWLSLQTGNIPLAARLLDEVNEDDIRHLTPVHREYLRTCGWLAFQRNDLSLAADKMAACATVLKATGLRDPSTLPSWTDIAQILTLAGRDATAAVKEADRLAKAWPSREAAAFSLLARAYTTAGLGALDMAKAASDGFAAVPSLLQQSRAELLLGQRWTGAGDARRARTHLRTAVGLALRAGSRTAADAARTLLLGVGGRMRVPSTVDGLAVLTASERKVVELAAAGVTNRAIADRLFVTLRTVEVHLTRAYRKLGISGRTELADVLAWR
ncbi:helix-turn-helix transcriptional regulator [Lentzea nigeriaca]|uniref:helix-turn-helix transcriptional regulator n=1 Tax=Lentzea nigeriaca TaxID=1128665 RepID=UPI001957371D|nr:LuxR family transcriptional regulator [Lentzea nigeriaca]MBM7856652.1 DNA-binding CsgD family transcriptional regulator/tetratricopeptide (TPR) repeat protein [Lentzea nigeriaca]